MGKIISLADLEPKDMSYFERGVLSLMGICSVEHFREGKLIYSESGKNLIPTAGLNYILNCAFGRITPSNSFYVGIFKGNYTPVATNTAANSLGASGLYQECQDTDYDPATNRPAYTVIDAAGGVITNTNSKAEFTMKADITVYGAFIATSQAKTATTGVLIAAKRYTTPRSVISGDVLYVTYEITATSS